MENNNVKKEITRLRKLEKQEQEKLILQIKQHKFINKEFIKIVYNANQKEIFLGIDNDLIGLKKIGNKKYYNRKEIENFLKNKQKSLF